MNEIKSFLDKLKLTECVAVRHATEERLKEVLRLKGKGSRWKLEFVGRTYRKRTICGKHTVNIKSFFLLISLKNKIDYLQ